MKHKIYFRQIFRTITRSMGRMMAILGIVALGAGFLAGLSASSPVMKETADRYFKEKNYMDVTLLCSLGITERDVDSILEVEGVVSCFPTYRVDAMTKIPLSDAETAIRYAAVPQEGSVRYASGASTEGGAVNQLTLRDGRMPEKADECVVLRGKMVETSLKIGDTLEISEAEGEGLKYLSFTVVGIVDSPEYISMVLGTTTKGSGSLNYVVYIPEEAFDIEFYTIMYVKADVDPSWMTYSEEYRTYMDEMTERLESWEEERTSAREEEIRGEIQEGIDAAYEEYESQKEDALRQLEEARGELEKADEELSNADQQIEEAQGALDDGRQQLDQAWGQLYYGSDELEAAKGEVAALQSTYQGLLDRVTTLKADTDAYLTQQWEQASVDEKALAALQAEWQNDLSLLEEKQTELDQLREYLESSQESLTTEERLQLQTEYAEKLAAFTVSYLEAETLEEKIAISNAALEKLKQDIADYQVQADAQIAAAEAELNTAYWTLMAKEEEYRAAVEEFESKKEELEAAKQEVAEGWEELNDKEKEANEQFDKALRELQEAENLLDEVPRSNWYVLPRSMNESYVSYENDSNRMKSIAQVFPWMFFVVAALVSLTTMTRMVEEERTQIGTYKALGFTKAEILNKYILYAGCASLLGGIIGVLIGFKILPQVICDAYNTMYLMPRAKTHLFPGWALLSIGTSLVCTLGATVYACLHTLRSKPAVLMLPAAPKAGKKIFLEYIPFLWKPLSFIWKVTLRNLFRYQKRFWMTAIGIAGCTGLMLTGYGIKDSIMGIIDNQFHKVYEYHGTFGLSGDAEEDDVRSALAKLNGVQDVLFVNSKMVEIRSDDASLSCSLFVPESTEHCKEFIHFAIRTSGEEVPFEKGSVLLTEKGASILHVEAGDSIWVPCKDGSSAKLKVTGICENYLSNYLYISPEVYEKTLEYETTTYTQVPFKSVGEDDVIREEAKKIEGITTVAVMDDMIEPVRHMLTALDYVIIVLIVSAAALAFIVLYNLTNINIIERQREIATIKVLGFQPMETASYIFRETILLTLIGCGIGMFAGIIMHRFVITTVEVDYVMFGRNINGEHFLLAGALTMLFSLLVDFVMYFHIRKINMVESLKSVE